MFRSIVLGGALLALLAACTDSSITEVKKSSISQSDFTYGEALDDAKGCKSTEWNRHDDGNGRPVVEYTCTAEMSSKLIENAKAENIVRVKEMIRPCSESLMR